VVGAEAAAEVGVGDGAASELADEGGAREGGGERREAQEDPPEDVLVVRQGRRRRRCCQRRGRRSLDHLDGLRCDEELLPSNQLGKGRFRV
jgi:hypothetical protein